MLNRIAIVGAGFCGTVLAANLLRRPPPNVAQIVLIDTPGIHRAGNALSRQMMSEAKQAIDEIDVLSLIVDAVVDFGANDRSALEWIAQFHGPVFLLLNKVCVKGIDAI